MCGIFGCIGREDSVDKTLEGLFLLQYRGHDSAGVVAWDKKNGLIYEGGKRIGTVEHLRQKLNALSYPFRGNACIGHTRYATIGGTGLQNTQPFVRNVGQKVAVAHNGDLEKVSLNGSCLDIEECRKILQEYAAFESTTDTELILHLLAKTKDGTLTERIAQVLKIIHGAFSLLFLTDDGHLIAARDPHGIRPLWIGIEKDACYFSSEDYALRHLGIHPMREVERGEAVIISPDLNLTSLSLTQKKQAFCSFEFVYFAFPSSRFSHRNVSDLRIHLGKELAQEIAAAGVLPDMSVIIPVMDSSLVAASGFHEALCQMGKIIPLRFGLLRNHYFGRSFITSGEKNRERCVDLKHIVDSNIVKDQSIGIIDDSIVRSTTIKRLIKKLRQAGAKEIHAFIPSPRIVGTCPYGIDMKTPEELIAAKKTLEETRREIGANSLHHLSIEGFKKCFGTSDNFCMGCFTKSYPTQTG